MTDHDWDAPDLTPLSTGVMTCRRCGAQTNNAFLASIYPCIPKGTDVNKPLDDDNEALIGANDLLAKRREMRRHYARTYADTHPLPPPEPVLEPSHFAPQSEDDAQAEFLAKRDQVRDSFWHGVTVGAFVALGAVAVLTGALLWAWR